MDKIKRASNVLKELNKFKAGLIEDQQLISVVNKYFDDVKDSDITSADFQFLNYLASVSGIPHYFGMLSKFNDKLPELKMSLQTLSNEIYNNTLHLSEDVVLHKYQKEVYDSFVKSKKNRFLLSASTSFGKTHLVFEIIKKMGYKNPLLIFPTIALLSENLNRTLNDDDFKGRYTIHTLSDFTKEGECNMFLYTPERYLSFSDKSSFSNNIDFVFIDEIYKIDNQFMRDEEVVENERDTAYRVAMYLSLRSHVDVLLCGPYLSLPEKGAISSLNNFMQRNYIELIDYNSIEIVSKSKSEVIRKKGAFIDETLPVIKFKNYNKSTKLKAFIKTILGIHENVLVYCYSRRSNGGVERYAKDVIKELEDIALESREFNDLLDHIKGRYSENWIVYKALKKGVGIHHGLIPKYIQKEIIRFFNDENTGLNVLFSTTTITEGVNTSAKNLIVMQSKKGDKDLLAFDAKNIAGRAGRFMHHYSGRVISLDENFFKIIESEDEAPLKHKNYDIDLPKSDVDVFYTDDEFLSNEDKLKRDEIRELQIQRGIPESVMKQFRVVSRKDKIIVFDIISANYMKADKAVKACKQQLSYSQNINYDSFQYILSSIRSIVKNDHMEFLIDNKNPKYPKYSTFTYCVGHYLESGLQGAIKYYVGQGKHYDTAISDSAKLIYTTLKYTAVKYFGVYNLMYKYIKSTKTQKKMEDIVGIDTLLLRFEYNAITEAGRLASDFGAPTRVIKYFEDGNMRNARFDRLEHRIAGQIQELLSQD